MNPIMKQLITGSLAALMAGTAGVAAAQVGPAREAATPGTERNQEEMQNATEHINKAIRVVRQMEQSPDLAHTASERPMEATHSRSSWQPRASQRALLHAASAPHSTPPRRAASFLANGGEPACHS